jgi:hypothetical protein
VTVPRCLASLPEHHQTPTQSNAVPALRKCMPRRSSLDLRFFRALPHTTTGSGAPPGSRNLSAETYPQKPIHGAGLNSPSFGHTSRTLKSHQYGSRSMQDICLLPRHRRPNRAEKNSGIYQRGSILTNQALFASGQAVSPFSGTTPRVDVV